MLVRLVTVRIDQRGDNRYGRFGSLADLLPKFSLMSASGGKAVIPSKKQEPIT